MITMVKNYDLPWKASRLHMIGQGDIMWPDIKLPFAKADHSTQHIARVHPNSHVDIYSCSLSYLPEEVHSVIFSVDNPLFPDC